MIYAESVPSDQPAHSFSLIWEVHYQLNCFIDLSTDSTAFRSDFADACGMCKKWPVVLKELMTESLSLNCHLEFQNQLFTSWKQQLWKTCKQLWVGSEWKVESHILMGFCSVVSDVRSPLDNWRDFNEKLDKFSLPETCTNYKVNVNTTDVSKIQES